MVQTPATNTKLSSSLSSALSRTNRWTIAEQLNDICKPDHYTIQIVGQNIPTSRHSLLTSNSQLWSSATSCYTAEEKK